MSSEIRTRMAPSPTGWLHVGNARTALFNYLFTRKNDGVFLLRIEDTDRERSRKEFEDDALEQLRWLGLQWDADDGKLNKQSERIEIYKTYLLRLLDEGKAFYCAHTKDELEEEHKKQIEAKEAPRHVCDHREGTDRGKGIVRLKNNAAGAILFSDLIRGPISFKAELLGDFSLARTLETPLYNFTVVIDDHEMRISHVIRGEDHIPNTPKQLLIQEALGWEPPAYAHVPLLLGTDRSKLSKRHGATAVRDYRMAGYLPEALVNFLALLGWNPGDNREIFTLKELEQAFSLEKVQKAGAVFNEEKLQWINHQHILKKSTLGDLMEQAIPFIPTGEHLPKEFLKRIMNIERARITKLSDITDTVPIYTEDPSYEPKLLSWKGTQEFEEIKTHLTEIKNILCDMPESDFFIMERFQETLGPYATKHSKGNVLWPLRVALSGRKASPGPFEIMYVIGKEATLRRIDKAIQLIKTR